MTDRSVHVGFVSTRIAGTDGVSLEIEKWVDVLTGLGHKCFYFAGESDRQLEICHLVPEAHFKHPEIMEITKDLFDDSVRSNTNSGLIHAIRLKLKEELYAFLKEFGIDLLIVENALSIPMNVPLGLALSEVIAETNIPTIGHHHDFSWERSRFSLNAAADFLGAAFPPTLNSIRHVVINSYAGSQLALRKGVTSILVPNVMDFENPPQPPSEPVGQFRKELNIGPQDHIILQPTRIVPRKRIELALELTRRLDMNCVVIITHESGDEGTDYAIYLQRYAELLGVSVIFGTGKIDHARKDLPNEGHVFSLADAYQYADLVTYPSTVEGFGNAFLETIYYKRPIVISSYEIFKTDIQPKGFRVIGFDEFISDETVHLAREVLENPKIGEQMADHNYEVGRRFYSYDALEESLISLIRLCVGA